MQNVLLPKFSTDLLVERLRQKFGEVGKVVDVFIPAKRDAVVEDLASLGLRV